jgi:hypothetical protein
MLYVTQFVRSELRDLHKHTFALVYLGLCSPSNNPELIRIEGQNQFITVNPTLDFIYQEIREKLVVG